jgi:CDP-diacylglycerol--glycerol-3-phosphate 3-phosphatidyltransferase
MTTANKITIGRILAIPVFVTMAVYYGHGVQNKDPQEWERFAAIIVFVLAAVSDGLDGYIARKYNQKSRLGVVLDPIADKGLLLAAIITLSFSNWHYEFPLWFPILVITRDLVILLGTVLLYYFYGPVHVRPSWTGKTATAMQMVSIACVLLGLNFTAHLAGHAVETLDILVGITGFFTFISGLGYVMNGIRQLQAGGDANA